MLKTENNNCLTFLFLINLLQWFSNYGPQTRSSGIIWELVRDADFLGGHPRRIGLEILGVGLSKVCFNRSSSDSDGTLKFEKHWGVDRGIGGMGTGVPFQPHL